ncbi:MAG: hypothetical protein JXA69_08080 [Phycisphaerae bacterium]|nr:hypothetical protein [Phycisphaerae bacterium]
MVGPALTPAVADAIRRAAERDDVVSAMAAFYEILDAAIAAHEPLCQNRGDCCRFDEYGHNLFVTPLEAAYFLAKHGPSGTTEATGGCPYQIDGRCRARAGRPLGCRVFHCDPNAQTWQSPLTEEHLAKLRALHERLGVPYAYVEWRTMLQALAEAQRKPG